MTAMGLQGKPERKGHGGEGRPLRFPVCDHDGAAMRTCCRAARSGRRARPRVALPVAQVGLPPAAGRGHTVGWIANDDWRTAEQPRRLKTGPAGHSTLAAPVLPSSARCRIRHHSVSYKSSCYSVTDQIMYRKMQRKRMDETDSNVHHLLSAAATKPPPAHAPATLSSRRQRQPPSRATCATASSTETRCT